MRQVRLIPSGCQYWNRHILAESASSIAYCSTLAIQIIDIQDFTITHILSGHEQNITSISWDPSDANRLASADADHMLYIWNLEQEQVALKITLPATVIMMEWNPFNPDEILMMLNNGDVQAISLASQQLQIHQNLTGCSPRFLRWHPVLPGKFLTGNGNGIVRSSYTGNQEYKQIQHAKKLPVEDAQWDPLSDNYALVSYSDGSMLLADLQSEALLQQFEGQGTGIKCIAWNRLIPGGFFTCNDKVAQVRVWNVSSKSSSDIIKIGNSGIKELLYLNGRNKLFVSFTNGSVGVMCLMKRKLEWVTQPGHTETIFDLKFHPKHAQILASSSYDGTIKIWDTQTMNNIETLSSEALVAGQYHGELATKAVIYSLAWSPSSDELIVAATSQGQLLLFDYKKAKLLDRHQPIPNSQAGIHRVTWQPSEYIACGTGDCSLVLFQITEGKLERYRQYYHPKLVYGVAWDPFQKSQIASGCVDSAIRIWDTSNPGETAIATLNGHSARVYNVSWHPQLPCVLASSSDDKDIIVWNTTSQQPLQILRGHTQNARPIQWSSEIPWLILSGSWDSTLRAWDARSGSCLNVVHDHHADIYGLVAHPSKPFTYVSCSRDTSIRFWSLDDLLQPLVLRSLMSQSIGDFLSTPEAAREASEIKLSGRASEELQTRLGNMQEAEKYREILTFFCESIGEVEFFDLIKYHLNGGKFNMNNRVSPLQEIAVSYRSRAEELESSSSFAYLGSALAKKEDRIKEAAKIHLKTGNIKQYCELMIKLGEWERAMAVAPSFCMDYWQYVANRYAEHLLKTENEEAGAVLLATKQVDKAIDFFTNQGDGEDALLIASTRNAGHLQPNATGPIPDYSKPKETGEDITILKQIVKELADHHTERCEPVLAAAYYLAIKDTESAITVLLQANEVLYAYVLTKVMSLKNREVYYRLAKQAMRHELYNLAEEILRPWPEMRELIIASTPILDPGQLYQSKNLLPLEEYTSRGQQHLAS